MTLDQVEDTSGLEIELKFELSAADVRKLTRAQAFKNLQTSRTQGKTLRAAYYDTPGHDLSGRTMALRVRQEGRIFVQCLKAKSADAGGAGFARREWEWPVASLDLDTEVLLADAAAAKLMKGVKPAKLSPIYATDIKRQSRTLQTPGGAVVQCDIDQGRVYLGDAEEHLCEMELELVSGPVEELFALAALIVEIVPARLSNRTKAGRGDMLARGGHTWVRAEHPPLDKAVTAEEVLRLSVLEGLQHLLSNEDCVLHGCDIEGVHQMRIATRRMRSVITTFKKLLPKGSYESLSERLRDAGNTLGPARDWDVFLAEVLGPVAQGFEHDEDLAHMQTRAEHRQKAAYAQAREMIGSPDYAHLLCDSALWVGAQAWRGEGASPALGKPAVRVAKDILQRRHNRLMKAGKGLEDLSIEHRHVLRIAIKKARYASAFFSDLYPAKAAKPYLKRLKELQEGLGHLNDLATAERLMRELAEGERGANLQKINRAAGKVQGWFMHAQSLCEDELLTAWKKFNTAKPFW